MIERAQAHVRRALNFEIVRYAIGGSTAVGVMMILLPVLVEFGNVSKRTASTVSLMVAVLINYFIQYYYTFRSTHGHAKALWRFLVVTMITLGLNYVLFSSLLNVAHYIVAQAITLVVIFLVNFVVNRAFTFKAA